jgi:hypothetical protein
MGLIKTKVATNLHAAKINIKLHDILQMIVSWHAKK